jgi:hypothetical protein
LPPNCRPLAPIWSSGRPRTRGGTYVVKDPACRDYFEIGEQEHLLLTELDGQKDGEAVCAAFEARFAAVLIHRVRRYVCTEFWW